VLQAIADACDHPDGDGNLIGAFGGSGFFAERAMVHPRTFWRKIATLTAAGFLVVVGRGGTLRVDGRTSNAGNSYGVPGTKGNLSHRRVDREMVRMIRDDGGQLVREVMLPGVTPTFWPSRAGPQSATTPVAGGQYPSGRRPLYHPPIPSPGMKHHEAGCARDGGFAAKDGGKTEKARKRHPTFSEEDLRDVGRSVALYHRFRAAGWISSCEADAVWFFAAVEHSLRKAARSPAGMLVGLMRNRGERCLFVTAEDEERARRRIAEASA
jgi:hypothetical protein